MITREMLAAMSDFELYDFIGGWTDPDTGECLGLEAHALLDCELLRRPDFFFNLKLIVEDWEDEDDPGYYHVPPSVPELRALLDEAKARMAKA